MTREIAQSLYLMALFAVVNGALLAVGLLAVRVLA
jgi:uncharacterized integral membrane protein